MLFQNVPLTISGLDCKDEPHFSILSTASHELYLKPELLYIWTCMISSLLKLPAYDDKRRCILFFFNDFKLNIANIARGDAVTFVTSDTFGGQYLIWYPFWIFDIFKR